MYSENETIEYFPVGCLLPTEQNFSLHGFHVVASRWGSHRSEGVSYSKDGGQVECRRPGRI